MSDVNVRIRTAIEKAIAEQCVTDLLTAGYELAVNNGGDEDEVKVTNGLTEKTARGRILSGMFATDDEYLRVYENGKPVGWVHFVYGNDGVDVISDYTVNLEEVLTGSLRMADRIDAGEFEISVKLR